MTISSIGDWERARAEAAKAGLQPASDAMETRMLAWLDDHSTGLILLRSRFELYHLDHSRFEQAWHQVVERHPVLASTPVEHGGGIWLRPGGSVSLEPATAAVPEHDDPFVVPLTRAGLTRSGSGHVFDLSISHLVADATSVNIVLRELSILYNDPAAILPNPGSFFEWADRQRRTILGPEGADAAVWWRERCSGLVPTGPVLSTPGGEPGQSTILVDRDLQERVTRAYRHLRVTWYAGALAAAADVLCGEVHPSIVFTTSWAHRRARRDHATVGCLTSRTLIPLERQLVADGPVRVQQALWDAFDRSLLPYARIREAAMDQATGPDGDPALPYFAVTDSWKSQLALDDVGVEAISSSASRGAQALEFWFERVGTALELVVKGPYLDETLADLGAEVLDAIANQAEAVGI